MSPALVDPIEGFEAFLTLKKGLSEKTVEQHADSIKSFLEKTGTREPTDSDVMSYRKELMESGLSNSHINNIHKAIEYYFEFQGREDELGVYNSLPRKNTEPNPYTDEEVKQFIEASTDLRDRAVVLFLVSSGVRNSAAVGLTFEDVDLERRTAYIRDAKQHNEYTAIFSEQAAEALRRLSEARNLSADDPMFPSRTGEHLTRSGLLQLVRRLGDRGGVENPTVHRFRATFANRLRRNGADVYRIQQLMGHSDIRSTLDYLKMDEEALREQHDQYIDDAAMAEQAVDDLGW